MGPDLRECLTPTQIGELIHSTVTSEGQLPANAHLRTCARCQEEFAEQRQFARLRAEFARLGGSPHGALPPHLPGYQVLRWLGGGGCGDVWLAEHPGLQQKRALKVLRASLYGERALAALRHEARVMAKLEHPNVVQVHDLVEGLGGSVLVMAFVEGVPLGEGGPMPWPQALRYVAAAADGVAEVHALGLLHGDIKPANLLLDVRRDTVKVGDFGLASHADRGEVRGYTVGFAAPEVLAGSAEVRSDVYALAATLFFLLTGRAPATEEDVSASLPAGLPLAVAEALQAGLAPKVEGRASLDEFRMLLRTVHQRELARELRQMAGQANGARLAVTVSMADAQEKVFRPVLTCDNTVGEGPPPVRARTGDLMRIEATADAGGHLTVLNLAATGEVAVVLPNALAQDSQVRPRCPLDVTGELAPPAGAEQTAVVWTRERWDWGAAQWQAWLSGLASRPLVYVDHNAPLPGAGPWSAVVFTVVHQTAEG